MKRVIVHPDADAELLEAMDWYDDKQAGIGLDLMTEVRQAMDRIENDPGVGARYRSTEIRFFRVSRFPYVIYYKELSNRVWVAAIAHERRRPGYWKKRKPE